MEFHMLFGAFAEIYGRTEWDAFKGLFPGPFLQLNVTDMTVENKDPMLQHAATSQAPSGDVTLFPKDEPGVWRNFLIAPLVKSERNDFPGKLLLGRSEVNDIVVPSRSVSKVHAFLQLDQSTGRLVIYDARSTFGTNVNDVPIPPGEGMALESGAQLLFGQSAPAMYFSPRDFFNYMRLKLRKGKTRKGL